MADIILDIGGNTSRLDRDIQKTVNRVYSINLKTKGEQPLGRITGKVNEFEKSLAASNARVIAFGASASIIYGVGAAFRSLAESVVSVQKSLQDINVILNVSNTELNKFGADLFNIAKNTGQSFDEVAKAATEFSRQGLGVAETLKRTNEALILSRLSGLDAAKSVEALTAAVNSFASQSVTATEIVNKFATVDAAFAVSSADLAEAIARVGSSAAQSGVSLNELIAIVTSAQQTTARGGAVIGNSFKTIFTRLQREKVVDLLGSLGISSTDSQGQLKSTIELLTDLGKVYDTLGSQQQAYVAEQVGGVFQINILKAALADLGKEYSIYNNALQVANSATDQAVRRNEELNKTFASQLNALQQNTKQLSSTVGERLLGPLFDRTVGNLNELLGGINESDANSFGATLGKGILDGIGQIIAGPGLILFGGVILKLLRDFSTYASSSAKDLLGLNNASKQQKEIQQSINQIISKNPDLYSLMQQGAVGLNQASEKLLNNLRAQTLELQEQKVLTAQVARALYSSGVRVTEGVPMVQTPKGTKARSGGFIPNFAIQSELSGIKKSPDYNSNQKRKAAGDIRTGRIPGLGPTVFNGQETFAKSTEVAQALGYPKGTKPKNPAQKYSILTPRMSENLGFVARGFVPNFAEDKNILKYQKGFAAGKVFDNAIALSLGLKKAYVEDRDVIDFAPNLLAPPKIDSKVKNLMGIDPKTLYGDAKLSDSEENRASFISKILRLPGTQIRNNTVIPASRGGSILIPGSGAKDTPAKPQNLRAGVGAILKKNPSVAKTPVFQNSGLEKGDSLFLPNVLIDSVRNITRQTVFGNVSGGGKNFRDFNVRKSAAENIASRFGFKKPKTFSSGFIPNFAQTATQSNKIVELGDTTTNPLFRGKVSSLIYPQISEGKSKAPGETTYLGKKYKGLVSTAGINKKALQSEIPDLEANLDQLLLREANEFGRAIGGTEFLQSASELPNIGAAKGAVGVSFEGGLLTLLKRDVQKSAQNARIDFTQERINTKFKSLFHGAPGTYEAKYSPSLTGEVLQKMLRGAGVGEVKQEKSGAGAGVSLKQREAVLASINKDVAEGKITQPRRGNALEAEIRRRLPLMFPGSVKGAADGFIPNFAAEEKAKKREMSLTGSAVTLYSDRLDSPVVVNKPQIAKYGSNADKIIKKDHIDRGQVGTKSNLMKTGSGRERYKARGFIPNFAETTIGVAADTQAEDLGNTIASVITQMSFFGFALQGSGEAYRSELERQKEVLKKNYETQNKLLQSAGKTSPKFLALSQAALKAEQRLKNLDKPYAASQAKVSAGLRSSAFPILTIAPILAETIANGIGKETKEQRVASAATSGAGTIASFAATGALIGGGIPGAVVGATVGGLITLVDVLKEASTDIPEFSKAAKEASERLTKLNDTSQSASQLFQSFQEQRSQGQDVDAQKTLKQLETLIRSQFKDTPEIATEALQAVRDNNFADFTSVLQRNISGAAQEDANKNLELILKKANEQFQKIDNLYNTDLGFFEQNGGSGPLVGKELEIVKGRTQDILSGSKLSSLELPELQTLRKRILELGFNFDKIGDIKELENLLKSIGYTDKQIALLTEGVDPKILRVVWSGLAEAITNQASIVNNAALDSVKADPINAKIITELEKIYKNYSLISQLTKTSAELQIKLNAQTRKNQQGYQAAVFEGDIGLAEVLGAKEEGRGLGIQKEITALENEARAPVFEGIDQLKTQIQELLNIRLNQQMARVETGAFTQNLTKGPDETDRDFNRRKTLAAADETRRILEVSGSQETLINTMEDILNTPGVRDENGGFNIKFFEDTLKARLPGVEGDAAQQEILDKIRATLIDIDVNTALAERQIKEQTRVILRQDLNRVMKELAQATISSFGGFEAFLTSDKGDKTLGDKFSDIATERANLVNSINKSNEPITEDARQALGRASGQTLNVLEDIIGGPLGLEIGGPNSLRGQEVAGRASQIEEIINEVRRTPGIQQDPALQQGIRATEEKFFQRAGLTEEYQQAQQEFAGDEKGLDQAITDLIKQASQNIAEIQSNAFRETGNIGSSFYEEALQTFSPEQQELLKQAGGQIEDPGTAAIILQNDEMIKQGGEQIGLLQDLLNNLSEAIPATIPTTNPNIGGDVNSSNSLQVSAPVTVTINTNSEGVREARARGLSEEEIQKLLQPKIEAAVQEVAAQINASFGSTREAVNNILNDPKNASYRPAPQTRRAETSDYVIR